MNQLFDSRKGDTVDDDFESPRERKPSIIEPTFLHYTSSPVWCEDIWTFTCKREQITETDSWRKGSF